MTYSTDFQEGMVKIYLNTYITLRKLASIVDVSKSTLQRWVTNKNLIKTDRIPSVKVNLDVVKFLKRTLDHQPFQSLDLLVIKVIKKFNITYSKSTIGNYLKILGYSKKKIVRRLYNTETLKEHKEHRERVLKNIKRINKNNLLCLDECSIDKEMYTRYGYCKTDTRLVRNINLKDLPTKRKNCLMVTSTKGVVKYALYDKALNGKTFKEFIIELVKDLKGKHILMDNVSFHKSDEIKDIIIESGNYYVYTPPYSPDFNPIEEIFSKLKSYIRKNVTPLTLVKNVDNIIKSFIKTVDEFSMYYKHAFN